MPSGAEEIHEKPQDIRCLAQGSNRMPPEYKLEMSPMGLVTCVKYTVLFGRCLLKFWCKFRTEDVGSWL
jgi:hypothetical protein